MHSEFQVVDKLFFNVKGKKISMQLGSSKKLVAIFCGPFEVLRRIVLVAYELALPPMVKIHNVFQLSLLKKHVYYSNHLLDWYVI